MDIHSRFLLDRELFEDLKSYLEVKKEALGDALLLSISRPARSPSLPIPPEKRESLVDALVIFEERWHALGPTQLKAFDEVGMVERLSNILWNNVEILEGMCRELFDQLREVPIDQWDHDLYDRLDQTKVHLFIKLKEMEEFIPALERSLRQFVLKCLNQRGPSFWRKIKIKTRGILDPELLRRIHEGEVYLHEHFVQFSHSFHFLKKTEAQLEGEKYKFQNFVILSSLEKEKQKNYRRLWRLLNLWEAAKKENKELENTVKHSICHFYSPGKTKMLLQEYLVHLKEKVFDLARHYRTQKDIAAQSVICGWRSETLLLQGVISKFRELQKTKELHQLSQDVAQIDKWLLTLFEAQELGEEESFEDELMKFKRIDKILQDMGQPLISKSVMKNLAKELVEHLNEVKELVSPLPEASEMMMDTLLRAFRIDQKHETLITVPGFNALWDIHKGLSHPQKSIPHQKRIKLYKKVTQHLKHWLLEHELTRHTLDAEHEIHDIQVSLQEFYHSIGENLGPLHVMEFRKELLEERVFFAHFFHLLSQQNSEGRYLRTEFGFVDMYFNAIDDKLNSFKKARDSSPEHEL